MSRPSAIVRSATARFIWALFAAFLALADAQGAQPAPEGGPNEPTIVFDIPAQRLARALQVLAEQAQLEILFTAEAVGERKTAAVRGRMTAQQALEVLLAGTGLAYARAGDVIVVHPVGAHPPQSRRPPDALATDDLLDETLVTGTFIRGSASASPLIVVDRDDIERSGLSTTRQLLDALPQNFGGGDNEGTMVSPGGSPLNVAMGSSVNLRGLGSDATLVLVDGHRIAPAAFGQFVDVSLIPLSAVERVEILADGASATYGADAVAGVVNFILRDAVDRPETHVEFGRVTHGQLNDLAFSQTLGLTGSRGDALLVVDLVRRSNLDAADRDYASGLEGPFDLLPSQKSRSVFATASLPLGQRIVFDASLLGSDREAEWRLFSSFTGEPSEVVANARQWNAALGTQLALNESWRARLDATLSRNATERQIVTAGTRQPVEEIRLDLYALDGTVDGTPFRLNAGEARLALGMHARRERYAPGGNNRLRSTREVFAAFAELSTPLAEAFELSLAARHERSSDYGETTTPKLGLRWSPVPGVRLRGTYGRSFRAPALNELDDSNASAFLRAFADPQAADGTTLALVVSGNNSVLGPERARTWTFGLDWQPAVAGNFDLGVTYFDTAFDDRIVAPLPGAEVLAIFNDPAPYSALIERPPGRRRLDEVLALPSFVNDYGPFTPDDIEALVDRRLQNLTLTEVSGFDLIATYHLAKAWTFQLNASVLLEYEEALTPTTPAQSVLDRAYHPLDLNVRTGVMWERSAWRASAFVNYFDASSNDSATPAQPVGSWTTLDFEVSYQAPVRGPRFALRIYNLFDADPPRVSSPAAAFPLGFDPTNANALGRFVSLAVTQSW